MPYEGMHAPDGTRDTYNETDPSYHGPLEGAHVPELRGTGGGGPLPMAPIQPPMAETRKVWVVFEEADGDEGNWIPKYVGRTEKRACESWAKGEGIKPDSKKIGCNRIREPKHMIRLAGGWKCKPCWLTR